MWMMSLSGVAGQCVGSALRFALPHKEGQANLCPRHLSPAVRHRIDDGVVLRYRRHANALRVTRLGEGPAPGRAGPKWPGPVRRTEMADQQPSVLHPPCVT